MATLTPSPTSDLGPEDLRAACAHLRAHAPTPLVVVDVDEVLALFMQGFDRFLRRHGHELRVTRFALIDIIYPLGAEEPADRIVGRRLFEGFFSEGCGEIDPSPDAAASLARLAERAKVVVLTNAPQTARTLRSAWLVEHRLDYPMVINAGGKGPAVRALADAAGGKTAFVDDLLPNLDSVAAEAPDVATFQMVADPRLRPWAPARPEAHTRIDEWPALADAIAAALA